ncbi:MAG: CYTH domain-containing protein [Lachnospiraceae bacterium]|nr:CYTH domain-containing protein [Lachnospiraceae bacterium]
MEIERKFLVRELPADLASYPSRQISQAYLCTDPVVRVRQDNNDFYLTYKGKGFLAREEYNLPLNREAYEKLSSKADGNVISKTRYLIPLENSSLTIELDVFDPPFAPLVLAEVEFENIDEAQAFTPPDWFGDDVTEDRHYSNSYLSEHLP